MSPPEGEGPQHEPAEAASRLLSIEEAEAELAAAASQEQDLELELEKLYARAAHLCQSESRSLAYAGEQHRQLPGAIRRLQETLESTSGVADELSGRVRKLDAVCGRVSDALRLVDEMLELRECSDMVMKTIAAEDFEQAGKYVARFRASQDSLPPGTDDASVRVLREAEQQLSAVVRKRFEAAMSANDTAGVSRFAKLFHPLGLAGEGVLKYVQFIRRTLAEKCAEEFKKLALAKRTNDVPTPYAEALTQVFVAIADIVQQHQQSVEQEFGLDNFLVVLRGLLDEADTQGLKVIEKFAKDNARIFEQQASCEVREVGAALEETAVLTQRTQQFHAYVHGVAVGVVELIADKEEFVKHLPPEHNEDDGLPKLSKLMHRVQELVASYVCVEQSFLLQTAEKAIRETDSLDPTDPEQTTTTLVDDVFFILQQSMLRSITTCDINAVCAVVNHVSAAVSGELRTALLGNLAESRRLYNSWISHPKNISPPAAGEHPLASLFVDQEGRLRSPLTAAASWPHSLNNLQQALEYLDKLKIATQEAFDEFFPPDGPDADKRVMFQHCITALDASKAELESLHSSQCKEGLNMLKPHLRPPLEPLNTIDYNINEAQYADFQVNDPFAKDFGTRAAVIHQHVKAVLNPVSCDELMQQMAEQTCRRIEKAALSKRFSLFGALQFETDVRVLCSFFTNASDQVLRHKFARLFEMASLLTLESGAELRELYSEPRSWRLAPDEARKLLLSRVDFEVSEKDLDLILPS